MGYLARNRTVNAGPTQNENPDKFLAFLENLSPRLASPAEIHQSTNPIHKKKFADLVKQLGV